MIVEDDLGYMWILGSEGLIKYDGYNYNLIPNQTILNTPHETDKGAQIAKDSEGNVWRSSKCGELIRIDKDGNYTSEIIDDNQNKQKVRLLSWISGRIWSEVNPRLENLHFSLGQTCGKITKALQNFDHPQAHGEFEWDTAQSLWTKKHLHLFNDEEKGKCRYKIFTTGCQYRSY